VRSHDLSAGAVDTINPAEVPSANRQEVRRFADSRFARLRRNVEKAGNACSHHSLMTPALLHGGRCYILQACPSDMKASRFPAYPEEHDSRTPRLPCWCAAIEATEGTNRLSSRYGTGASGPLGERKESVWAYSRRRAFLPAMGSL